MVTPRMHRVQINLMNIHWGQVHLMLACTLYPNYDKECKITILVIVFVLEVNEMTNEPTLSTEGALRLTLTNRHDFRLSLSIRPYT